MNVLFTITCNNQSGYTGRGGHYYSLVTIAEALVRSGMKCQILVIGREESPVISQSGVPNFFVYYNGINLKSARKKIRKVVVEGKISVIHSFDSYSYIVCGRLKNVKIKRVLTKCGGANPGSGFPIPSNLILFSKENLEYVKNKRWFSRTKVHLIPNRVKRLSINYNRCDDLRSRLKLKDNTLILMRIARICAAYEGSFKQTFALARLLEMKLGKDVSVVAIGKIQDHTVYERLKIVSGAYDFIITNEEYTYLASDFLGMADFVVATGRGVMEACGLGKIVYVPVAEGNGLLPVPLTHENFDSLFYYNFSPRHIIESDEISAIKAVKEDKYINSKFSYEIFDKDFSVDNVVDKYLTVYKMLNYSNPSFLLTLWIEIRHIVNNIRKFYLS